MTAPYEGARMRRCRQDLSRGLRLNQLCRRCSDDWRELAVDGTANYAAGLDLYLNEALTL